MSMQKPSASVAEECFFMYKVSFNLYIAENSFELFAEYNFKGIKS